MNLIYFAISIIFALTIHEFAHAWTAYKLGDNTAKYLGRISLNPLRHLDIVGTICFILIGIGWGKPVPINPQHFANPKRDQALVALAGPLVNLLTAFVIAIPYKYSLVSAPELSQFLKILFEISISLFAFNLLPIPPLDGSKIIGFFVPDRYFRRYENFMHTNVVYILILLLVDFNLLPQIIGFSIFGTIVSFMTTTIKALILIGT